MDIISERRQRPAFFFHSVRFKCGDFGAYRAVSCLAKFLKQLREKSRPDFLIKLGLVVTPSMRPASPRDLISAMSAVSAKNFMGETLFGET